MEQLLIKIRGIVNNNKQQKTRAFYSVVYAVRLEVSREDTQVGLADRIGNLLIFFSRD
jgi:hypothetical protein